MLAEVAQQHVQVPTLLLLLLLAQPQGPDATLGTLRPGAFASVGLGVDDAR